jgi:hypothetical protein
MIQEIVATSHWDAMIFVTTLQDEQKILAILMCWFSWDAMIFVTTLQDDSRDSSNIPLGCYDLL